MKIFFTNLGIEEKFKYTGKARKVIQHIIKEEKKKLGEIHVIFTSNSNILGINRTFLKHSYFTDVITFENNYRDRIAGDIYISIEQVVINSEKYKAAFVEEIFRVIIHGVLHLAGYVDDNEEDRRIMRIKEDYYLQYLNDGF